MTDETPEYAAPLEPLTAKEAQFVAEFLVDLNGTQAAIRAGYSAKTARQIAARLLSKVNIQAALEEGRAERIERTRITADMVLERWWMLATADPSELQQLRRHCCRYCHGTDHLYQYRDQAEFDQAVADAKMQAEAEALKTGKPVEPVLFVCGGGFGYDPKRDPAPKCPKCDGEGVTDLFLADTRKLSPGGKALFAGVKSTAYGLEVKMNDQAAALESIARHLGMYKQTVELSGKNGGPMQHEVTNDFALSDNDAEKVAAKLKMLDDEV